MLYFRKLSLSDIAVIEPYFRNCGIKTCDYTVGGSFMWRDYFDQYFAISDGTLVFKVGFPGRGTAFTFPIGLHPDKCLDEIEKYASESGIRLSFCMVAEEQLDKLLSRYKDPFVTDLPEWGDYIYDARSFGTFAGKKLAGQRNHVNRFDRLYPQAVYKKIGPDDIPAIKAFLESFEAKQDLSTPTAKEDALKTFEVLDNYEVYGMFGGMLTVDGRIVGFSIGEKMNDTLFVHIEKADTSFEGGYQKTANMFAKTFSDGCAYVNREDDAGDEGLRKSKLSYRPVAFLKKYMVCP